LVVTTCSDIDLADVDRAVGGVRGVEPSHSTVLDDLSGSMEGSPCLRVAVHGVGRRGILPAGQQLTAGNHRHHRRSSQRCSDQPGTATAPLQPPVLDGVELRRVGVLSGDGRDVGAQQPVQVNHDVPPGWRRERR
jgi:hypothetical protein